MVSELHGDKDLRPAWKRREHNKEWLVVSHVNVDSSAFNTVWP